MTPKRTSTSAVSAMTQAAIRKLVADIVATALEAQAANMENADNTNRNTEPREAPVAIKCSYKEFMSCQAFNFKGTEGAVGLIHCNCTEDCKVKFATGESSSTTTTITITATITTASMITTNSRIKGLCTVKWHTCNKVGHQTNNCKNKGPATGRNLLPVSVTCHACGEKGHYKKQCTKANNSAQGRAYMLRDRNTHQDPNVVTCTIYDIEIADGNLVSTNTVIQGCTLILLNQHFEINLMPIKLGSVDVVIGIDWLSKYHARIICDEKVVYIRINSETLIIRAQVMEKKSNEKRLKDILVVREFLEFFPEDLPGLPPVLQVEFQIDLIPGAAPVARAPYRLAPSGMQELSDQLQELAYRGFI
nr:putative reverse transcriptase domain-containing protein [Tanacetum cinerariifolium]